MFQAPVHWYMITIWYYMINISDELLINSGTALYFYYQHVNSSISHDQIMLAVCMVWAKFCLTAWHFDSNWLSMSLACLSVVSTADHGPSYYYICRKDVPRKHIWPGIRASSLWSMNVTTGNGNTAQAPTPHPHPQAPSPHPTGARWSRHIAPYDQVLQWPDDPMSCCVVTAKLVTQLASSRLSWGLTPSLLKFHSL